MGRTFRSRPFIKIHPEDTDLEFTKPGVYASPSCDGGGGVNYSRYFLKLRKGENLYTTTRQFRKHNASPCLCCFMRHGRSWMKKGLGDKALCKTKGLRREKKRFESDWRAL